jgi:hypothetical protein
VSDGSDDLQLAIYRARESATISVAEWLELDGDARRAVGCDLTQVAIRLVAGGVERLAEHCSMGELARLVPQLAPAQARIAAGAPALIRSGELDAPEGAFLYFEPRDGGLQVSMLAIAESPYEATFLRAPEDDAVTRLYAYVAAQRDALVAAGQELCPLDSLPIDRAAILTALPREAELGAKILSIAYSPTET